MNSNPLPWWILMSLSLKAVFDYRCELGDVMPFTNGLSVHVTAPQDSLLVFAYAGDRNWQVSVDGASAELFPVNGIFMGVVVPAGSHSIRLLHRNNLFLVYALICIALAGLLAWYALRRPSVLERVLLGSVSLLIIGKSIFLVPGIGNDEEPGEDGPDIHRTCPDSGGLSFH